MCGIFGFIGKIPEQASDDAYLFLRHLFIQSKDRGTHASGFATVHGDSPLIIEKRAIPADNFVFACSRFKALKEKMPSVFIGHTRHATTGTQSRGRNNHPFNSPRYTMVHNGHIDDWDKLAKSRPIKMRSETDSEVIIRLLDEKHTMATGVQHVVNTVDKDSKIAIAVIEHQNKDNRKLFLFRKDNPISVLTVPAWRAIFFASTQGIIENAMKGAFGLPFWQSKKEALKMDVAEIPTWNLLEFSIDGNTPHLSARYMIDEKKSTFTTSSPIISSTNPPMLPALPGKVPDNRKSGGLIDTTDLSPATKTELDTFNKSALEVSQIMNAVSSEPFMTLREVEHWREWLKAKY